MRVSHDPFFQAVQNAAATHAHRLAARLCLSIEDRQDVQQELIIDMLERANQFDPSRGSGGFLTGAISQYRATKIMDRLIKDRMRLVFGFGAPASNEPGFQPVPDLDALISVPKTTRAMAVVFGVTAGFIAVRMKKYGLIPEIRLSTE